MTAPAPPAQPQQPPPLTPGPVTLVGAGPGDAGLLTLKAARAIAAASVILADDLVSDEVLAHASADARITRVGKRGSRRSAAQDIIAALMIEAAYSGENVVRLKGGDPFIFGRGGEEVQSLRRAGIEPVIISGITAGAAALASLGASLTHRDHAQGVVLVTGHAQKGSPPLDWVRLGQSAAELRLTLVIYMGVSTAAHIQASLLQALPASTPVAVIERATCPDQRHCITRLDDMAPALARHGLGSPAILVVGDVVKGVRAAGLGPTPGP